MRQGLAAFQAIEAEIARAASLARLAEAYGKEGQAEEGLTVLAKASDMTSVVKWGRTVGFGFARPPLRATAEPEPVIARVDQAEIRGLATTLLASVRRLARF